MLTPKPLLLGLMLAHGLVWAQGALRDPTMPPPGFRGATASAERSGEGDGRAAQAPALVRITPVGGRQQAGPEGQTRPSGERIRAGRMVSITANGMVLKDSRGARAVPMPTPSVSKKAVAGPVSEK